MSQFEEIPSPGRGFQGSRALGGLAACKTLASKRDEARARVFKPLHAFVASRLRILISCARAQLPTAAPAQGQQ